MNFISKPNLFSNYFMYLGMSDEYMLLKGVMQEIETNHGK